MWTKIDVTHSKKLIIILPADFAVPMEDTSFITVRFGGKSAEARIQFDGSLELVENSSYDDPGQIIISNKLKELLLIPLSQVYQVIVKESCIILGPVIGLLLGNQTWRYTPKHMEKYSDRFGVYDKVGGLIYAFYPKSIDWVNNTAFGLYHNIEKSAWEYGYFPLPEVIYRRDFHSNPNVIKKLSEYTNNRLFNSYRFNKYEMYNFINKNDELRAFLPPTEMSVNFEQVKEFIDIYLSVIIKPVDLSRGRGICIIEKNESGYKITDYRNKEPSILNLTDDWELNKFFDLNQSLFYRHIIQRYLPLAKIGNALFDVRIVMHKQKKGVWECSGIECRVSENLLLTNISKGGYALSLQTALNSAFKDDYETLSVQIDELCQKFCLYMDTTGEHFAEFGIDIAIDINKKLWIIEANVFPSFKGFKKTDSQTYLNIRYRPLLYALSLTSFGFPEEAPDE